MKKLLCHLALMNKPRLCLFLVAQLPSVFFILQQEKVLISELSNMMNLVSQCSGITALIFLASCSLFSFRHKFTEKIFSGLDNLYSLHHFSGICAVIFIAAHIFFLSLSNYIISKDAALYVFQVWNQPWNIIMAWLSVFLLLAVITAASWMDRGHFLWRYLHLLGVPAFLSVFWHFHSYTTSSGVLKVFLYSLSIFAFIALLTRTFRYLFAYKYIVTEVKHLDNEHIIIRLSAEGEKIKFNLSQFVFVCFHSSAGYRACNEYHPFTVISAPDDQYLELIVRARGNCTCQLQNIVEGVRAHVEGPFGGFKTDKADQLWVGGGVGVSSFLALLKGKYPALIDLYYVTKSKSELVLLPGLMQSAKDNKNIAVHAVTSDSDAVQVFSEIKKSTPDFASRTCLLSGPPGMIKSLKSLLASNGLPFSKIKHETFGFL